MNTTEVLEKNITINTEEVLNDYRVAVESREASLLGRKEVFMGRAKFGIFGDGKEVAQIAMAKSFQNGDFRSGYYRDQTFMFAIGELTIEQYFAQLYAHTNTTAEPASAGRMMNSHFGTRFLDDKGNWKNQTEMKNVSSDISPTAGQMSRSLGLAFASKLYRQNVDLHHFKNFSRQGNEVSHVTIGNASTSEGVFFEAVNAAGVLQVPLLISVWDDEYGISVSKEHHTTKESISEFLKGIQRQSKEERAYEIFVVKGWDYAKLLSAYQQASEICRREHVPALVHVIEMTQPQGHSTSGSHERYKSKERLAWEDEFDCIRQMRLWILANGLSNEETLEDIEKTAKKTAKDAKNRAWKAFVASMKADREQALELIKTASEEHPNLQNALLKVHTDLKKTIDPIKKDAVVAVKKALRVLRGESSTSRQHLLSWLDRVLEKSKDEYNSYLYSQSEKSALKVPEVKAVFTEESKQVDGREVLQACFDKMLENYPETLAFGEDVGKIGDVNQAFAGLQAKHGELRVMDTGIRENTIIGQALGASMRGLRPIAEIQYLDYLLYAIQILSDDLATVQYRSKGGQKAPMIIRTRGHRLEGIWHSGSPMGMIINSIRGVHVLVPRNMTQAAGMYNTMLQSDEPALIIECLNGYRLKERIPENVDTFTVPLGRPEIIREGSDVTVVTYGSMCRVVLEASEQLAEVGISTEVIDVQTLLPFDLDHNIVKSIQKTNRVVFADEDVPGGTSAYMMQKVVEEQNAYYYLDSKPETLSAEAHRPAYASDGDYFSKPSVEDVFDTIYAMMREAEPNRFEEIY